MTVQDGCRGYFFMRAWLRTVRVGKCIDTYSALNLLTVVN